MLLRYVGRKRNGLHRYADERSPYMAPLEELVDHSVDGLCGQREAGPPCQRGIVDGEHCTGGIDEGTSGETVVDSEVQSKHAVYACALPCSPAFTDRTDDTEARRDALTRSTDGEHQ